MTRVPFGPQQEEHEYVATSAARLLCAGCGEWVYAIRRATGGPTFIPRVCPRCETPTEQAANGEDAQATTGSVS